MSLFLFTSVVAAAPVAAVATPIVSQQSVERRDLTAAELFALADRAIADQRLEDASTLLSALMADPNKDVRLEATFRLAKLDAAGGRMREAAVRYRRILDERPDAQPVRLELAAHLAKMGDLDAARRELRYARAGILPPAVAQLVDRFSQAWRSTKPFGGSLQVGTTADSNINRATRSDTLGTVIGDFSLDEDARERSGHGLSVDSQAFLRFAFEGQPITITGSQSADIYRHKAFNDVSVGLKIGPEFAIKAARLNLSVGAIKRWFGGDPFTDTRSAEAIVTAPVTASMQSRVSLTATKVTNHRNRLESGLTLAAGLGFEKALSARTGVGLVLSAIAQNLRDPAYSTRSLNAGLIGYRTLGRMTLVATASIGRLVADERIFLYPEKRRDWTRRLGLGTTFRAVQFMGFSPTVQFSWERNSSSIEIYHYRRQVVELGIAKAF